MSNPWAFPDAVPEDLPAPHFPVERLSFPDAVTRQSTPVIEDAVIVVPGIMGTELIDTASGKRIWGLSPTLLARMWSAPTNHMTPLAVRDPAATTVTPGRLLRLPGFAPFLAGAEPYTKLVKALQSITLHPSAVREFGYDWRLPVQHNAVLLARAVEEHITQWRARADRPDARIHIVAHSMGGLLCQAMAAISGAYDDTGLTFTLGTPFDGAAKALQILADGGDVPLPSRHLREIATTMPGLYDLLPSYRCVDEYTDARRLTPADLAAIGADQDLAREAFERRKNLVDMQIPRHHALIGVEQGTVCSVRFHAGRLEPRYETFDPDLKAPRQPGHDIELRRHKNGFLVRSPGFGDGTVPRNAAEPYGADHRTPLAQQHGPIAKAPETISYITDTLLYPTVESWQQRLGPGDLGITAPDIVTVGTEFDIPLTGVSKPNDVRAYITDLDTQKPVRVRAHRRDGILTLSPTVYSAGLYRITASTQATPVEQLILAVTGDRN